MHMHALRFAAYQRTGKSASMIDHFYDKLLHIVRFAEMMVENRFFLAEARARETAIVRVALHFGRHGRSESSSSVFLVLVLAHECPIDLLFDLRCFFPLCALLCSTFFVLF